MQAARGRLPEWPKGAVCKTVGSAYVGSNPTPATQNPRLEPLTRSCVSGSNAENKRFRRPLAGVVGHVWARSGRPSNPLVTPAAGPRMCSELQKRSSVIESGGSGRGRARLPGGRPCARVWAMHGHMADRTRAVPAVRGTACFWAMRLVSGVEGSFDLPVGDVVLAVDAVRIVGQEHCDAVPGPLRDLGGGSACVQPQ